MNITNELMAEVLVTIKEVYDVEDHGVNIMWYGQSYEGGNIKGGMNVSDVVNKLKTLIVKRYYPIEVAIYADATLLRLLGAGKMFEGTSEEEVVCVAYKWLLANATRPKD